MKTIKFIAIATLFLGFSVSAMSQTNPKVSATASAGARIITPLSIVNTDSLQFGNIVASSAGGTVIVATDATATYDGVAAPFGLAGDIRAAKFTVTGDGNSTFSVLIAQETALTSGSGNTMNLSNFTENSDGVLVEGTKTFAVGATLNVGPNQAAGTYKGSFKVTVAYQ